MGGTKKCVDICTRKKNPCTQKLVIKLEMLIADVVCIKQCGFNFCVFLENCIPPPFTGFDTTHGGGGGRDK